MGDKSLTTKDSPVFILPRRGKTPKATSFFFGPTRARQNPLRLLYRASPMQSMHICL
jgi:hypothetical protein